MNYLMTVLTLVYGVHKDSVSVGCPEVDWRGVTLEVDSSSSVSESIPASLSRCTRASIPLDDML